MGVFYFKIEIMVCLYRMRPLLGGVDELKSFIQSANEEKMWFAKKIAQMFSRANLSAVFLLSFYTQQH